MVPSSTATAVFLAAAASLLLKPALATSSSRLNPNIAHEQMRAFINPGAVVLPWSLPQAPDAAAPSAHGESDEDDRTGREWSPQSTVQKHEKIVTQNPQSDNEYSAMEGIPLDGGPELKLKRSEGEGEGEGEGAVLLARETSAAPTVFGVSIWLILAWLGLLYLMFKTGSMF